MTTSALIDIFPSGGWDVHHHVFEREYIRTMTTCNVQANVLWLASRFPYSASRHLTPPPATVQQFVDFKRVTGLSHSVLTHGLSYGSDCTSLLAFLSELGSSNTKGISVIDPDTTSDETIALMHDAGVRGIRVNLYKYSAMHDLERQKIALREHARRITRFPGWTMAFTHVHPEFWGRLRPVIEHDVTSRGIRLVTDHFALLKGPSMLDPDCEGDIARQDGFAEIVSLVRDGLLWVKLSGPYRVSELGPDYQDLKPLVRAFVDANPRRVLYGSDWPHTPRMSVRSQEEAMREMPYLDVDDLAWLRSLKSWLSEEEWELMVLRNPRELYDW